MTAPKLNPKASGMSPPINARRVMEFAYKKAEQCPDRDKHTPMPSGYVAHAERAEELLKTHRNVRCSTCGYYAIWEPKQ